MRQDVNTLIAALQEVQPVVSVDCDAEEVNKGGPSRRRSSERIDRSSQQAEMTGVKASSQRGKSSERTGYVTQRSNEVQVERAETTPPPAAIREKGFVRQRSNEEQAERAENLAAAIMEEMEARKVGRRPSKNSPDSTDTEEHDSTPVGVPAAADSMVQEKLRRYHMPSLIDRRGDFTRSVSL